MITGFGFTRRVILGTLQFSHEKLVIFTNLWRKLRFFWVGETLKKALSSLQGVDLLAFPKVLHDKPGPACYQPEIV